MQQYTVYVCEKCGQEFRDYGECTDHEDGHIRTKSWDLRDKGQYTSPDSRYPDLLTIKMEDGTELTYELAELPIGKKEAPQAEQDGAKLIETPSI